jgi:formaldehyde-activating enzyme involved in methanogenesis
VNKYKSLYEFITSTEEEKREIYSRVIEAACDKQTSVLTQAVKDQPETDKILIDKRNHA